MSLDRHATRCRCLLWDGEKKTLYDKILNNQVIQVPKGELMPIFVDGNPI